MSLWQGLSFGVSGGRWPGHQWAGRQNGPRALSLPCVHLPAKLTAPLWLQDCLVPRCFSPAQVLLFSPFLKGGPGFTAVTFSTASIISRVHPQEFCEVRHSVFLNTTAKTLPVAQRPQADNALFWPPPRITRMPL